MSLVPKPLPEQQQAIAGRQAEMHALRQAVGGLDAGQGGVVMISGEPGIGKSTLARWAADQARKAGLPVYWGFSWEAGGAPPYWPWTQCLRALLAGPAAPSGLVGPSGYGTPLAQLLPELASEGRPGAALQPDQARFQLLEAVRSLLTTAAAAQPFMLVLEDLHAADSDSLALLKYVCQHAGTSGFLLLGTFREMEAQFAGDASPLWHAAREALQLRPSLLQREEVGELLKRRGEPPPAPATVQRVLDITEGNPLFLSELLALMRDGLIPPDGPPQLPGNVRQVILKHLQTLPEETFAALAAAAVLGRQFSAAALAGLLDSDEAEVIAGLQPALQALLLSADEQGEFRFAHAFHRDVLYACLDASQRQKLHLRRAAALQEAIEKGVVESWSELAEHLLAAGSRWRPDAIEAWRRAGARAAERLAFDESFELFRRALKAFGAGPGADPAARCDLLLQGTAAGLRAGQTPAGQELCREAFRVARALEDPRRMARSALTYGSVFQIARVDPQLVRLLREALCALETSGHSADTGLRARLQARLAAALQPASDPAEPMKMAKEAVALARATGDSRILFDTLNPAISALMDFAPAPQRVEINREYAGLAEAFEDVPEQFRAHTLLIMDGLELGDPELMDAAIEHCARLAGRIGLPHYQWRVYSARALRAAIRGEIDGAQSYLEQAQRAAVQTGDRVAEMTLAIQSFDLLAAGSEKVDGRWRDALERIAQALRACGADDLYVKPMIARQLLRAGDAAAARTICSPATAGKLLQIGEMSNIQLLGECAVLRQDVALGRRVLDILSQTTSACGHSGLYGMTWNGPIALTLAKLSHLAGEARRAEHYREAAREVAERMGALDLVRQIDSRVGEAVRPAGAEAPARPVVVLTASGDYWQVAFGDRQTTIKDIKGMQILARLLAEPDREFHVLDLNDPAGAAVVESAEAGAGLDEQARRAYRTRLSDIEEALEEARELNDHGAVDQLLEERDALQVELGRAFGLGGRSRPTGSAAERARVNVTRRLRDAIARIGEQIPEAGQYLDSTVKTGTYCRFSPL